MRSDVEGARPDARPLWLVFVPYMAVAIVHVGTLTCDAVGLAEMSKLVLMPTLALALLWGRSVSGLGMHNVVGLLLAALCFSWLGDSAGMFFPFAPTLPLMLGFFGLAHLLYMWTFWRHLSSRKAPRWAWLFALWWLVLVIALWTPAGSMAPAVAVYGVVLGGTAALATRCNRTLIWGGMFFLASDTVLAFRIFTLDLMPAWTSPLVMLTYTVGQGLIVAGALMTLRRHHTRVVDAFIS